MPHISNRPIKAKPMKLVKRHEPTISDLNDKLKSLQEFMETEFRWLRSRLSRVVNRSDLQNTEEKIDMRLSEVKTIINQSAGQSKEAFAEIGAKLADLQKQIDDLIAGNSDPDITDEQFLTDLNQVKTDLTALSAIVPNPTAPPTA